MFRHVQIVSALSIRVIERVVKVSSRHSLYCFGFVNGLFLISYKQDELSCGFLLNVSMQVLLFLALLWDTGCLVCPSELEVEHGHESNGWNVYEHEE